MRNLLGCFVAGVLVSLALSSATIAQTSAKSVEQLAKEHCGSAGQPGTLYQQLCADSTPAPPAAKHDVSGAYTGSIGATPGDFPPLTPLGQKLFAANKGTHAVDVAVSNDPLITCDPLGFPRNAVFEVRGLEFVQTPIKVFELFQYEKVWREIWTDGRALPKNAGTDDINAPDSRYYGYAVGHWDGDYTLVVNTVGTEGDTWLDNDGHPHSNALRAEERYTRKDHNTLQQTVTIDDPTIYTKPFLLGKATFKWIPEQEFEEQLCIPSKAEAYTNFIANPAGLEKK
jgi:hypothetical protein